MSNSVNITYGGYDFQEDGGPIPFLDITRSFLRSEDGESIGTRFDMSVNGTLTPLPAGADGYVNIDTMQDTLLSGFDTDGKEFKVTCDATTLLSVYPKIGNISLPPSRDNWTQTSPYTINLFWEGDPITDNTYVESVSESWNVQIDNSTAKYDWDLTGGVNDSNSILVSIGHSVSAKGIAHYDVGVLVSPAWQQAREWVVGQLGCDGTIAASSGVLNLTAADFSGFNHSRVQEYGERAGSFSVQENWIAMNTGVVGLCGNAIEDFTASVQYSIDSDLTTVSVNGTIQGLETINYGSSPGEYSVTEKKYDAASGYWNCIKPKLLGRATLISSDVSTRSINPTQLTLSIGHNPSNGFITYAYSYDDRPCNFVAGSLGEDISITDLHPVDVFASLTALGRAYGPILQDVGTVTESKKAITINVMMPIYTGCSDIIEAYNDSPASAFVPLLCTIEESLSGSNVTYFKSQDQSNWNPKTGRFSQSVEWTYAPCGGDAPSTSFCS